MREWLVRGERRLVIASSAVIGVGALFAYDKFISQYHRQGVDFSVYRAAGLAVLHGRSLFSPWMASQMKMSLPFTYPPLAAVVSVPFGLLSFDAGFVLWNLISVVALVYIIRTAAKPLLARFEHPAIPLAIAVLVALALTPVQDELGFGQVGIVLMAMCFFDCLSENPRWPRGGLIGAATAVKLLPGIFIPYLWLSGRRRAAYTAAAIAAALTLSAWLIVPDDSHTFWTSRVFDNSRVGNNAYRSNQALNGILRRLFGDHVTLLWLALAAIVAIWGLRQAARVTIEGNALLGVVMAALVGCVVSPVSWIHHLVWIVPALLVLVGDGTDRVRTWTAIVIAALFTLRLPYAGDHFALGLIRQPLWDAYGLICLALVFALPKLVEREPVTDPVSPRAPR
jgi:alpha-1,2-mannosyltransferase